MATEITMPKLSDTMEEGTILGWRVKEGDHVSKGDIIAEVETDKAAMEMEAFEDGVVTSINVAEGETVKVGTVLAVLGEEAPAEKSEVIQEAQKQIPAKEEGEETAEEAPSRVSVEAASSEMESKASPAARRLAREKGLNLERVVGSGPQGRIVLTDVEKIVREAKGGLKMPEQFMGAEPLKKGKGGEKSLKIRRLVARKMMESWQSIPHFYVTVAVDITDVIRFRKDLKVTINDFILAAVARSLKEHPWVNSHWIDGEAVPQKSINLSMAVATDRGLYNPVIKNCENLSLKEIGARSAILSQKAQDGQLNPEDLEGGTFTISNMGMLGVESFCAIITPPQAAVLAVGTVKGEVVVDENGEPAIAPTLRLTLSADHRTLDGADVAEFLVTLKSYLEAPVVLVTCQDQKEDR